MQPLVVGGNPSGLAVDRALGHVFLTAIDESVSRNRSVLVVDARSGQYLQTIPVRGNPDLMVVDEHTQQAMAMARGGVSDEVSLLDARSGAVLHTARVDDTPSNLVVDDRTGHLFVISAGPQNKLGQYIGAGHVTLLDGRTGTIVRTIRVGRAPGPAAVDTRTERVFVANQGDGTVSVLNASDCLRSPADPAPPAAGVRFFPATRHNLSRPFLAFWLRYGGADTFGYPRTEPFTDRGHVVQYTDRFELELVGGQVRTAPLGRLLTAQRTFPRVAPVPSTSTRLYFADTGHTLSGRFLAYWRSHHGATLLGAPISELITEGNGDGSGRRYPLQWFEKGRLEDHAELAGTRYALELGLLGVQALQQRGWLP